MKKLRNRLLAYIEIEGEEAGTKEIHFGRVAIIVIVFIVALWLITLFSLVWFDGTTRGTFGDMFGSINALFSGLALAGIILTILMQRQELQLQRDELKETRNEFITQNETLKVQRFENTFFNLLNLHHQIVNSIDYSYYKTKEKTRGMGGLRFGEVKPEDKERVEIKGRDFFKHHFDGLSGVIKETPEKYEELYLKYYHVLQTDLGHYFRNLYRIIKFVDQTDFSYQKDAIDDKQQFQLKYQYTSMIRAQLSDYELLWIFYNGICEYGEEKFKPLIEKYSLLKNIPDSSLPVIEHKDEYAERAFHPNK